MAKLLIIVRDSVGALVPNAYVFVTGGAPGVTDSTGSVTITLPDSAIGTKVQVTATATGFLTGANGTTTVTVFTTTLTVSFSTSSAGAATQVPLHVTDGSSAIAGAQVFKSGASVGVTDASGNITLSFTAASEQVQVTAAGYVSVQNSYPSTSPITITLARSSTNSKLTLVSSPPGAVIQIQSESGVLDSSGTFSTLETYPPGTYQVTLTSGASSQASTVVVVAGQPVYQVPALAVADSGAGAATQTVNPNGAAAPSSSQPGTVSTSNTAASASPMDGATSLPATGGNVPDYEFTNPDANYGRYFTATQARMYLGNLFIEELAGCQYVLQANKIPIYGYASTLFDAVGSGKTLVQGQLMVHFISEGYLYTALSEYKKTRQAVSSSSQQQYQDLVAQEEKLRANATPDASTTKQIQSLQKQRRALMAADPTLAAAYKRTLLTNASTAVGPNPVYMQIPFTLDLEFEGGGRTVKRKLTNCILTSNEQILGDNDTPLFESYGFIAQILR